MLQEPWTKSAMNFNGCTNDYISHFIWFHLNLQQRDIFTFHSPRCSAPPPLRVSTFASINHTTFPWIGRQRFQPTLRKDGNVCIGATGPNRLPLTITQ
ncbi:hypothetical protein RISK_004778 [Rhodopirellula islandica]|uniref:Uncharacterized protein n=1 Tax=Rhodopirellula islandica TaxID=595434 RepID=A0A0J1EC27_RHOIS|nr:hypothetical protein RISK_004778 [Rhodopirellula islandica]